MIADFMHMYCVMLILQYLCYIFYEFHNQISNGESVVDCTSFSISACSSMKRFTTRCTRQDYMIAFIITEEHFHKEYRVPH